MDISVLASVLGQTGTVDASDLIPATYDGGTLVTAAVSVVSNPFISGTMIALVGFAIALRRVAPKLMRLFGH